MLRSCMEAARMALQSAVVAAGSIDARCRLASACLCMRLVPHLPPAQCCARGAWDQLPPASHRCARSDFGNSQAKRPPYAAPCESGVAHATP